MPPPRQAEKLLSASDLTVGEHLQTTARVMMRVGEDLSSEFLGYAPCSRLMEVLQIGRGRRVRVVEEQAVEGWVSVTKPDGFQLLRRYEANRRQKDTMQKAKAKAAINAYTRSTSAPSVPSTGGAPKGSESAKCDKCDGPHPTSACPFFPKARDDHKDAWANYGQTGEKKQGPKLMGADGGNFVLQHAQIIRQPGDGSCLFHSMSFGLSGGRKDPSAAEMLRRELAQFIERNSKLEIAGDTIEDWIQWDMNTSATAYARQMAVRGWGGGVEMACCSHLKSVNVHVYERDRQQYKRISCFNTPRARKTIHVLYQGRAHYDALVPA